MAASSSDSRSFLSDTRSTSPSYVQDRPLYEPPYKKKAITDDHEKQKTFAQIPWANIKIRSNGRGNTRISQTSDFLFFASFSPTFICLFSPFYFESLTSFYASWIFLNYPSF